MLCDGSHSDKVLSCEICKEFENVYFAKKNDCIITQSVKIWAYCVLFVLRGCEIREWGRVLYWVFIIQGVLYPLHKDVFYSYSKRHTLFAPLL